MDCEGCERRVRKAAEGMKGVTEVQTEPKKQKVTVVGHVDPEKVLHRVRRRTGKKAEYWPFVPVEVVDRPYVAGVYDKKAPPGFVRNTPDNIAPATSTEVKYVTAFSDENPNACTIM